PKPMLPVLHRPMIVHLVERLATAGVTDVVLALGFKPEPFRSAFPDGTHGGVRVHYAVEPEPLDTAGAIGFAAREVGVDDTFLVANGDIISDLAFGDLVASHHSFGGDATIHLTAVADPSAFGVVELEESGAVRRFVEKPEPGETDSNLINAGTYVLEPAVLELIPPLGRLSVERSVFPELVSHGRLYGTSTDDYWLDTGRPDEYLQANLDLIRGARKTAVGGVHPHATLDAEAIVVESVIGPGASVAAGATVTDSLLLPDAEVGPGSVIERSIVAGSVGDRCVVTDAVLGANYSLPADTTVVSRRLPDPG
ncbi:sugar phosphate nucleotidyltransferase, partial [Ilumatobacter sp.]|uniref:sugar phosphate nucleotidyltransferase n=1 Tax=Ilumatobacter sp. TaxID=1967498 RepID=UPI003AF59E62